MVATYQTNSVETKHPTYTRLYVDMFRLVRDAYEGEAQVKDAGTHYLPMPSGFNAQSDNGTDLYNAYRTRAQFPEIMQPTISAMVGLIHGKEIKIELPSGLEYLIEKASADGITLEAFHRRVTSALLKTGRHAVLVDAESEEGGDPYLAGYAGDRVINWETDGTFVVIDDSGYIREGYSWKDEKRFITLQMADNAYTMTINTDGDEEVIEPKTLGNGSPERIPFAIGNARDVSFDLLPPPLIGVARAAKAIYQLSADYRWQLFMSGQETLVAINGEAPSAVGAGVAHSMMGSQDVTPDLKYVSPTCAGIDAHKEAMLDNRDAAVMAGAKLIEQETPTNESGYARKLRTAAETATLITVAKVSSEIMEKSLRNVAMMQGLSDSEQENITVEAPKDLIDAVLTPQDAKTLVESWQAGGFSYQTLYENLQRGGIADPDRELADELELMDDDPETIQQARLQAVA